MNYNTKCKNKQVKIIRNELNVYSNKHALKRQENWITLNQYLKNNHLVQYYFNQSLQNVIGYFIRYSTDIFAFDIDSHSTFFNQDCQNIDILNKYNLICKVFGLPSFVNKSPNGLHAYFKIQERLPYAFLKDTINKVFLNKTGGRLPKDIEVLPTPNHSLRLPKILVNPHTLDVIHFEHQSKIIEKIADSPRYRFIDVFKEQPSPLILQESKKNQPTHVEKRKQIGNMKTLKRLNEVESAVVPILKGESNEKIERLCFAYFLAKIPIDEAIYRLEHYIKHPNRDTSGRRLKQRVENHFKRIKENWQKYKAKYQPQPRAFQMDLLTEKSINAAVESAPFYKNRKTRLKNFLTEIWQWSEYVKNQSNEERVWFNFYYPFHWHNTKDRGLTPLPKSLLVRWWGSHHYYQAMNFLKEIGIIEEVTSYSSLLGTCKYYKIVFNPEDNKQIQKLEKDANLKPFSTRL